MERDRVKPCVDAGGKVRLVARIRGFTDQELASSDCVSVVNVRCSGDGSGTEDKVGVLFGDPTYSREYMVDYCYGQSETNVAIFSKEVKPHISRLFDGENSTFIAFGARGSGKTYTFQGDEENFGLGMLAIDEILRSVEGTRYTVAVSIYEELQDHIYDLLDTNKKEVRILEDAQGKITFKGLSKVHVKSLAEFQKLYCGESSSKKPTQKIPLELPRSSHKALVIHVLASDEEGGGSAGKLNFVDLAGYENTRISGIKSTESMQKSLYTFIHVIYAINASESRVPYRDSKLARMLQNYVGGTNSISMIVCLNPLFCVDTIHAIAEASKLKVIKPSTFSCTAKKRLNSSCSTTKKQTNPRYPLSAKKPVSFSANSRVSVSTTKKQTKPRFPMSELKRRNFVGDVELAKGIKEQASSVMKSKISGGDFMVVPHMEENSSLDEASSSSISVPELLDKEIPGYGVSQELKLLAKNIKEKCSLDEASSSSGSVPELLDKEIPGYGVSQELKLLAKNIEGVLAARNTFIPDVNADITEQQGKNALPFIEGLSPLASIQLVANNLRAGSIQNRLVENCVEAVEPEVAELTHTIGLLNCELGTKESRVEELTHTIGLSNCESGTKESRVENYLQFFNSASEHDLRKIKDIGEKRATSILDLRKKSPEPFTSLEDLKKIGLSAKQVDNLIKNVASFFSRS